MGLADEKYILLTTYRRNGTPVPTPVWVVSAGDDEVGFYSSSGSGKAKRLAHTDRVTMQPCNARGRVREGTQPVAGRARVVTGQEVSTIHEKVNAKYGFITKITKLLGTLGGIVKRKRIPYGDIAVIITPAG